MPVIGRGGGLEGLLVLGPRLSEEPYSSEDRALLASAAAQAGLALENIRLAEAMAAQLDAERRRARELEIAREPSRRSCCRRIAPALPTLEYVGALPAGARDRRRLLRLHRRGRRQARPGAGRHLGQGHLRGPADGQPAGSLRGAVHARAARPAGGAAHRQPRVLRSPRHTITTRPCSSPSTTRPHGVCSTRTAVTCPRSCAARAATSSASGRRGP